MLNAGVEEYIKIYSNADILSVSLKKSPFPGITSKELAQQLQGKQIAKKKFPTLYRTEAILYPKKVHLEQASSEDTAIYKASLVSGKSLLDLTCGMGVDAFHLASGFEQVICYEKNEKLLAYTAHNLIQLGRENIEVRSGDGVEFLRRSAANFDCIYIDPSRRKENKKVFLIEDYEPDLVPVVDEILARTDVLLIKTSPLLDIDLGIKQLKQVAECHVVAVRNEVRELLWLLRKEVTDEPIRKAINIEDTGQPVFEFLASREHDLPIDYSNPQAYMYEPNAAILKSGGFKSVAEQFHLKKLAASSHLYTGELPVEFPGRRFKVLAVQKYSKNWNKEWGLKKANIARRNFPTAVAEIRRRYKIADGGSEYLFFTTLSDRQKVVIRCVKY